MLRNVLTGAAAGAVGTVASNVAIYADMAIRGRPASDTPAQVAGKLAEDVGLDLTGGMLNDAAKAQQRRSGIGALMGYATGLGVGTAYGLIRPSLGRGSVPVTGLVIGLVAMAASDVPAVTTGATNPAKWGVSGWIADLVPHLVYGVVTALVYEAFSEG
ncbi:MAG TPA: hypothetical protein VGN32_04765 [Ktedonobacterales bacterium]|nr:hypothetical protein [Ktedonobacterales bacterium]